MRVEIRGQGSSDVCARVDRALPAGEVQRDGNELRVGVPAAAGGDVLRAGGGNCGTVAAPDGRHGRLEDR